MILASKSLSKMNEVRNSPMLTFEMRDLTSKSSVFKFLGFEMIQKDNCLIIHQKDWIKRILYKFGMNDCKISNVPMQTKLLSLKADKDSLCI